MMNSKTKSEKVFIQMLADECSSAIMALTSRKEYSAMQLSRELDMPLSTLYRKLKLLENARLIQNVKMLIDRAGNQEKYYRCTIREGRVSINFERLDYKDRFVMLWKRFSRPAD